MNGFENSGNEESDLLTMLEEMQDEIEKKDEIITDLMQRLSEKDSLIEMLNEENQRLSDRDVMRNESDLQLKEAEKLSKKASAIMDQVSKKAEEQVAEAQRERDIYKKERDDAIYRTQDEYDRAKSYREMYERLCNMKEDEINCRVSSETKIIKKKMSSKYKAIYAIEGWLKIGIGGLSLMFIVLFGVISDHLHRDFLYIIDKVAAYCVWSARMISLWADRAGMLSGEKDWLYWILAIGVAALSIAVLFGSWLLLIGLIVMKYLMNKEHFDCLMRWVMLGSSVLIVALSWSMWSWIIGINLILLFFAINVFSPLVRYVIRRL